MRFRDLQKQYEVLKTEIDSSIRKVCSSSCFISGPEVLELESKLAEYVGSKHCITCANGTDAITLAFMTWGLGSGDAVFVPDFTFFASGECPANVGCTCIFVDVDEKTYNIDSSKLEKAVQKVINEGVLIPRAVVAVDLFGQPAEYEKIINTCRKYNLLLLEDGAQGFGGEINGKKACGFGDISTTSFFPAKPLGCYGDGGAIFTNNDEWAELIRSYAVHGKSQNDKYENVRLGINSRLDSIQAAILLVKLKAFDDYEVADINNVAATYREEFSKYGLDKRLVLPTIPAGYFSSWAQYTIQLPEGTDRERLQQNFRKQDIPTMVYYKKPMHKQVAFQGTVSEECNCPVTEMLCSRVLSLPISPYMTREQICQVVQCFDGYL